MKKLSIMILLAFSSLLVGCDNAAALFSSENNSVGAYSKQRRPTEEQKAIFYDVITGLGDRVEYTPLNVGEQVVAGKNLRFLCKGREKSENGGHAKKIYAEIIIHQPLPGQGNPYIISVTRQKR